MPGSETLIIAYLAGITYRLVHACSRFRRLNRVLDPGQKMKHSTFITAVLVTGLAALALPFTTFAQTDWPQKPVTMVVPYRPGGVNDAAARVYANKIAAEFGKPMLIDNRAGAATTVASNYVAKAPADGYTIYAGGTSLVINPTLTGQVQYDPQRSFELVSLMSFTPFILHLNTAFPARNMAELIAHVKANLGKFNIASSGIGVTNHLIAELFKLQAGPICAGQPASAFAAPAKSAWARLIRKVYEADPLECNMSRPDAYHRADRRPVGGAAHPRAPGAVAARVDGALRAAAP